MRLSRIALIGAAACALAISACAKPVYSTGPGADPPTSSASVLDARALFAVEAAYNVAASAYVSADSRDLLPAATKATVRGVLVEAYAAVQAARAAYRVGDAITFAARARDATALAQRARVLTPG